MGVRPNFFKQQGASLVQLALGLMVLSASVAFAFNQYVEVQSNLRTQSSINEVNQWAGAVASLVALGVSVDASRVINETSIDNATNIYGLSVSVTDHGRDGHEIIYPIPSNENCASVSELLDDTFHVGGFNSGCSRQNDLSIYVK